MQTACSPKSNSLLYSRIHYRYTASEQRTRLVRSATRRMTLYFHSLFVAHSTQNHFSHRFSSTRRPQKPISTLSRTHNHYSYTHTAAPHSYRTCTRTRTRTRTALTLPCTRRQTAKLTLYTCAWSGGSLSGVLALGTGQPCLAGRWVSSRRCYSARLANTSVEVRFRRRFLFAKTLTHFVKKAPMCSVSESLDTFTRSTLPRLVGAAVFISFLPLPRDYVLGSAGEAIFALHALVLLIATGLVSVSWWVSSELSGVFVQCCGTLIFSAHC